MKSFVLTVVILSTLTLGAQDRYHTGMQKAMEHWSNQEIAEATNLFERIARAEPDRWLPPYYVALIQTISAFGIKDEAVLSQQLGKAAEYLALAEQIDPGNAEITVVKAMINTAYITYDGSRYGMTLSPLNDRLYRQALEREPNNPRVVISKAEWDMGSARYFGKDITPYCGEVERALRLFEEFNSEEPFYPSWGRKRALKLAEVCSE